MRVLYNEVQHLFSSVIVPVVLLNNYYARMLDYEANENNIFTDLQLYVKQLW